MDAEDREWKERLAALPRGRSTAPCPRLETLSTWTKGPLPEEAALHLASCAACREELIDIRRPLAEKGITEAPRAALRARLHRLQPDRRALYGWIAAAAAALVAILI